VSGLRNAIGDQRTANSEQRAFRPNALRQRRLTCPAPPGTELANRSRIMNRQAVVAVVLLALLFVPPHLHGVWVESLPAVRTEPPAEARRYWQELIACTRVRPKRGRGFDSIQWHLVAGRQFVRPDNGRDVIGLWLRPGNAVVLAADWWDEERLIKHELLHVLLQSGSHEGRHFSAEGGEACGLFAG